MTRARPSAARSTRSIAPCSPQPSISSTGRSASSVLAEAGLQQPGLEAAGLALGLLGEEAGEQAFDPPHDRPLGRVVAEPALGRDLRDQLARPRRSSRLASRGGGGGRRPVARDRGARAPRASGRPGPGGPGPGRAAAGSSSWRDEPAVGADVEPLQGRAAVGAHAGRGRSSTAGLASGPGARLAASAARAVLEPGPDALAGLRRDTCSGEQRCRLRPRHRGRRSTGPARSPTAPRRGRGRPAPGPARRVSFASTGSGLAVAERRLEQSADVVEEGRARPRRRRSRRCRGRRGRAGGWAAPGRRGRGSAPRHRGRGGARARARARCASERNGSSPRSRRGNSPSCSEATKTCSKREARRR